MLNRFYILVFFSFLQGTLLAQATFQEIANQVGINHQYTSANTITGGGVSFYDFDNDGLDDLTLATGEEELLHFYKNTGAGFQKLPPLIGHLDAAKQILWIDFDNDGDNDLFVATYYGQNRLYENMGDLHLVDITASAGLHFNTNRTYGAAFADYDRDGWLDLYFTERVTPGEGQNQLFLYKNNADGTFTDVSIESNAADLGMLPFCASFLDYNNDNWPDIYIANDKSRGNTMLENQGDGTFLNVSEATQTVLDVDGMSVAVGDYNNDGWSDIYCTNLPEGSVLLQNNGFLASNHAGFSDISTAAGVGFYGFGWGSNFLDADNDGDLDLYVSGNLVETDKPSSAFYTNNGDGTFQESLLEGDTKKSYNNAIGDFNNDGLADIMVINTFPYTSQLWQNESTNQNWLKIELQGVKSNRAGVGSKIESYANADYQMRYTHCGIGFLGQNSGTEVMGLAEHTQVDSLVVTWPTGHVDRFYNIAANQKIVFIEGSSTNGEIEVDEDVQLTINESPTEPFVQTHFVPCQDTAQINHIVSHSSFMGGGAAFFDYDKDGDDDLYITSGKNKDHFYENLGDGRFEDKTETVGFAETAELYTMGVVAGDIDNDGYKDLFITTNKDNISQALAPNLLYKNNGDGTFTQIWDEPELVFSIGATFIDFDLDGLLDLYVVTYVDEADFLYDSDNQIVDFNHDCFKNLFYKNLGAGNFGEIAGNLNLDDTGCALAIASTDFNQDGNVDLLLANDFGAFIQPNKLYQSDGMTFSEVGAALNANTEMYGMGIAVGDIDKDLDLDYYITNFGKNALLRNDNETFTNITDESGTGNEFIVEGEEDLVVSWGTAFVDIDNDTDLDLFVSNGYVPSPSFLPSGLVMNDKLYLNNGDLTFADTGEAYGISNRWTSRGMAYSDFDNDGDVDILSIVLNVPINESGWQTTLNRNEWGNQNNWFQVSLEGVEANRDGYGSRVFLYAGEEVLMRESSGGSSHCSSSSSRLHFGLGDLTQVDSVQVWWPGAQRLQTVYDMEANQHIQIVEDTTIAPITSSLVALDASNQTIHIYPNPASEQVFIELEEPNVVIEEIRLVNGLGQIQQRISSIENNALIVLNTVNTAAGMYYVLIKTKEHLFIKKLILE